VGLRISLLLALSACTYDFSVFGEPSSSAETSSASIGGAGGAAGGTAGIGASGGSDATTTSGTGGKNSTFQACAGITDDFTQLDEMRWEGDAGVGAINGAIPLENGEGVWLADPISTSGECAFTVAVLSSSNGSLYFNLKGDASDVTLTVNRSGANLGMDLANSTGTTQTGNAQGTLTALALVSRGGSIHGLYSTGGGWFTLGSVPRPAELDNGFTCGFGVTSGEATFDDFGGVSVAMGDVP
jgi:hypothetical protein